MTCRWGGGLLRKPSKVWMSCLQLVLWPFNIMSTNPKNRTQPQKGSSKIDSFFFGRADMLEPRWCGTLPSMQQNLFAQKCELVLLGVTQTVRCTIWMSLLGTMSNLLWTWFDCSDVSFCFAESLWVVFSSSSVVELLYNHIQSNFFLRPFKILCIKKLQL